MKIMIVDDHADMRRCLRNLVLLSLPWSVDVIECEDGSDAVNQYAKIRPDCVLMDVQMKSVSGFDAAESIMHHDPNASIIFVTSHNLSAYKAKAQSLHAKGFVTKDNLSELNTLLHQLTLRGGSQ